MIPWERQRGPDGAWRAAHHPHTDAAADALFRRAGRLWGGPLPGIARAVSTAPLRVELYGWPPERFVRAAGVPPGSPALSHYWQLTVEGARTVGVYHSMLHLAPLPALPAGVALCPATTCLRSRHDWNTAARVGPLRLYLAEARPGAVRGAWPTLAPAEDAGPHGYYGIDYRPETGAVVGIQCYRATLALTPPGTRRLGETVGWLGRAGAAPEDSP